MNKQLLIIKALQVARNNLQALYAKRVGGSNDAVYAFACNAVKHSLKVLDEVKGEDEELYAAALAYLQPYAPLNDEGPKGKAPLNLSWWRADIYGLRMRIAMLDLAIEDAINASVP